MKKASARTRIIGLLEEYEDRDLSNERILMMEQKLGIAG